MRSSAITGKLILIGLATIKPTHDPQVKKGEQPGHSFSLEGDLSACSFFAASLSRQSVSEQHGLVESKMT